MVAVRRQHIVSMVTAVVAAVGLVMSSVGPAQAADPVPVSITVDYFAIESGTDFTATVTMDNTTPQEVMIQLITAQGNMQAFTQTLQPGTQDLAFKYTFTNEPIFKVEFWDGTGGAPIEVVYATAFFGATVCRDNGVKASIILDSYYDFGSNIAKAEFNGQLIYGPVTVDPQSSLYEEIALPNAVKGQQGTLTFYLNDEVVLVITEPVPDCRAPLVSATIVGTKAVGSTLTCKLKVTAYNLPYFANFGWYINGAPQEGKQTATLKLTSYHLNKSVKCSASVFDMADNFARAESSTVKIGLGAAPVATTKPSITGATLAKVGYTLKVKSSGVWSPKTTYVTGYQWCYKSGTKIVPIKYATKSYYKISSSLKGKTIVLKVTKKRYGYKTGIAYSAPTYKVK